MKDHIQKIASQISSSIPMTMPKVASSEPKDALSQGGAKHAVESVIQVMFGACTTGSDDVYQYNERDELKLDVVSPSSSRERSKSTCEPADPDAFFTAKSSEKHVISAISKLRETEQRRQSSERRSSSSFPVLFPASSPSAKNKNTRRDSPVLEGITAGERSFDDTVSEISANTLEEMALAYEAMDGFKRIRSDRTQDPHLKAEESWKQTVGRRWNNSPESRLSPVGFTRGGRSSNTRHTYASESTMTLSHDFADFHQKNEQNYWSELVKEEDHRREPSPRSVPEEPQEMLKLNKDGTITTVHSSTCSATTPAKKMASRKDPNKLLEVMAMPPGTEIGEI